MNEDAYIREEAVEEMLSTTLYTTGMIDKIEKLIGVDFYVHKFIKLIKEPLQTELNKMMTEADVKAKCVSCGCRGAEYGADPYAAEIGGDDTPVWECSSCRCASIWEI